MAVRFPLLPRPVFVAVVWAVVMVPDSGLAQDSAKALARGLSARRCAEWREAPIGSSARSMYMLLRAIAAIRWESIWEYGVN